MCLIRAVYHHAENSRTTVSAAYAVVECRSRGDGGSSHSSVPGDAHTREFHVLEMDFFDEQNIVIVFEPCGNEGLDTITSLKRRMH